jgi:hypothetical protein
MRRCSRRFARRSSILAGPGAISDVLPKSTVNDLVGLYSWIESSSYLYQGDEAQRIRQAAREAEEMVFRYVAPAQLGE